MKQDLILTEADLELAVEQAGLAVTQALSHLSLLSLQAWTRGKERSPRGEVDALFSLSAQRHRTPGWGGLGERPGQYLRTSWVTESSGDSFPPNCSFFLQLISWSSPLLAVVPQASLYPP